MTEEDYEFWSKSINTVRQWQQNHPQYSPKLYKIKKKLQEMQIEFIKYNKEYHLNNRKSSLDKAEKLKKEAEELLKKLSRLELLATLSK